MGRDQVEGLQSLLSCGATECMQCVWTMGGSGAVATRQCGGVDQVNVEKVANAARPSGWTPTLALMGSDRVHTVRMDNARQWRACDATVWGSGSGQSRKNDKCGATEWRDSKACFRALRQSAYRAYGQCEAVARLRCDSVGEWIRSKSKK
jgi:hypothetical protein